MTPRVLYDASGVALALGRELGRGGEGSVFELAAEDRRLVKLYHRPIDAERTSKILAMVGLQAPELLSVAAWPVGAVSAAPGGSVVGFLMPRGKGKAIHSLYGPKSRLQEFPGATWPFLIQTAANLARAFAFVQAHGCVVGDVNQGNCLVSPRATVTLIDCDSFQVHTGARRFPCTVGTPLYTPPELVGRSLAAVERTVEHDRFGLAVLIFQLLFLGRHLFAGRYFDPRQEMPIERAIEERRFAYGAGSRGRRMEPPPFVPSLEMVGAEIAALFERAFAAPVGQERTRPADREWISALESLRRELTACATNPAHWYPRSAASCPWCAIEANTGVLLFILTGGAPASAGFDLEGLWRRLAAAAPSAPLPAPAPAPASASPQALQVCEQDRRELVRGSVAVFACLLTGVPLAAAGRGGCDLALLLVAAAFCVIVVLLIRRSRRRAPIRRGAREAGERLAALSPPGGEAGEIALRAKREDLERMRAAYLALPRLRKERIDALRADVRKLQLQQHLDRQRIAAAKIKGIGPGRSTTLASYGVETAWDVTAQALSQVHGFGPKISQTLLAWRAELERGFVFDPTVGIPPLQIAALDLELTQRRARLESGLSTGVVEWEQRARAIARAREERAARVARLTRELAQAQADLRALSG